MRKILWAVDAYDSPQNFTDGAAARTLETLVESTGAAVEPLYLLNHEAEHLLPGDPLLDPEHFRNFTERQLARKLKSARFLRGRRPKVISPGRTGVSRSVHLLSEYAKNSRSDMIVVYTHGRSGLTRLVSGSFAETLIQNSPVPLFVMNPKCQPVEKFERILFTTDFSRSSGRAFLQTIGLAQQLNSKIILLHAVPTFTQPVISAGVNLLTTGWIPPEAYITKETDSRRRRAELWGSIARRRGIPVDIEILPNVTSVTEAILDIAGQREAHLIAMCSQSDALTTALLGSITRNIIRQATCPVWVMRCS